MDEAAGKGGPEAERLRLLRRWMLDTGTADSFTLDPSITRGLDYYTGLVFESFLTALPELGSVCSGGRYDNLVGLYSKEGVCGVGASVGLDRLIAGLEQLGKLSPRGSYAAAALACLSEAGAGRAQALADLFRDAGVPCEVFLEGSGEKISKQYALAEKKGIRWLIIPPETESAGGKFTLRDLRSRENREGLGVEEAVSLIKKTI
jgi:histidyl-tRNA synthetase